MIEGTFSFLKNLGQQQDAKDAIPTEDLSKMAEFSIDEYRPMKVIVIGAGLTGVAAAIRYRQYVPNVDVNIYEKNDGIGGTWYLNRYPGVACDNPAHCFAYTFEHKGDWSACYSPGHEILQYINHVVDKWNVRSHIKLQHEVVHMQWDEPSGQWVVRIRRPLAHDPATFEEFEDRADVVLNGTGALSRWKWPDIEGLHNFKGPIVHSACWDFGGSTWEEDVKDWGDKNVVVVGLGSSALQIVTALQPKVGKLFQVCRGQTWVSPPFSVAKLSEMLGRELNGPDTTNLYFTEEEKKLLEFQENLFRFRQQIEAQMNTAHKVTLRDSELQKTTRAMFTAHMVKSLEKKPWIVDLITPDFSVGVKRITAAPGYLEALCADNCDFVHENIKCITSSTVEAANGQSIPADVIICATGFDTSYKFPFPIIGRNGMSLDEKWSPYPRTYIAACTDGFPNLFFAFGPNSSVGTTSILGMIEHHVMYSVMATMKLQRERLKSIEVKPEAVSDFDNVMESIFSESVPTWYKVGKADGRIVALWPGSSLHCMRALRYPRWEDFNYERVDKTDNRLFWLGDGMTYSEKTLTGDRTWYINPNYVDVPPTPES
ncbi:FAD/NAD-P-binding domain-containing protein [Irpex rosettiformis]|uniref:FAD/NAD-P-binding domain-containing protein n=1 Tax=Irpex rosettiformis TaxID=378272 RepID=A0ACB8U1Y6_9APHY|nr:FAD/NAD-P-binding domain-containing protein [Irpex rosettiformis]